MTNNINYDNIPAEIKAKPNWVGFKVTKKADGSGWNKLPINVKTGSAASVLDTLTWTDFDAALSGVKNKCYGISDIGYAFDGDGIIGIDIDHCTASGEFSSIATDILGSVSSYTEYSVSGSGIHIIARTSEKFESGKHGDFEIYRSGRFFVFTGNLLENRPTEICDCTEEIQQIYTKYMPHKQPSKTSGMQCVGTVLSASNQPINTPLTALNSSLSEVRLSDEQILEIAMAARNGARFAELWRGDVSAYPSYSEADLALCNMLSFYTAKDEIAIDRLFRKSGLYAAEDRANKWDTRHGRETYGEITIRKAINNCRKVYKPKATNLKMMKKVASQNTSAPRSENPQLQK